MTQDIHHSRSILISFSLRTKSVEGLQGTYFAISICGKYTLLSSSTRSSGLYFEDNSFSSLILYFKTHGFDDMTMILV